MAAETLLNECYAEDNPQGCVLPIKFLFHNNESSIKDEMLLLMFILVCIGAGFLFYIFAPNNWAVSSNTIKAFGIVWILAGVMFIPCSVYRLFSNDANAKN